MGDSDKLDDSGPDSYTYAEQREYLWQAWRQLGIESKVTLVLHDWGSALGFDWAANHPQSVKGIAYMEGIPCPVGWEDWPEAVRPIFQGFRSEAGESHGASEERFHRASFTRDRSCASSATTRWRSIGVRT